MDKLTSSKYEVNSQDMHLLLRYSDVFDGPIPNLNFEISQLHMHKSISVITELISVVNKQKSVTIIFDKEILVPIETFIKAWFFGIKMDENFNFFDFPIFSKKQHIISLQALLLLLKRLIACGNYDTLSLTDYVITDEDYKTIIKLQLAIVEEIYKKNNDEFNEGHFLYSNFHLNNQANVGNRFLRMNYMLEFLCRDLSKFEADIVKEYRDYYTDFLNKYGISTTQYSSLLFWELRPYYTDFDGMLTYSNGWREIDKIYTGSKNQVLLHKVLEPISIPVSNLKQWALDTEDQLWDFTGFLEYPFLRDNFGRYISVSEYTLSNGFFGKLFWLIRDCYPQKDSRCMAFFGRLYEKYIQAITENATSSNYQYIKEFTIPLKKGENPKSSDAYLQSGTRLLAVEAKGFMDLIDVMSKNESINKNNHKLFIDPILQADTFLDIVINGGIAFNDITEIFIISVSMDNINANPMYYTEIFSFIEDKKKCSKVKYYFNFNVEEYEILMYLVETGADIFVLLKDYFQERKLSPFSNYARLIFPNIEMTSFMKTYYNNACKEMFGFISNNEKKS